MERAEVMMKRIREQLEAGPGFRTAGVLKVSRSDVPLPSTGDSKSLKELVQTVAERITETVVLSLLSKPDPKVQTDA
jgi:hypothetical protein